MIQHLRWFMQGGIAVALALMVIGAGPCWVFISFEAVIVMFRACLLGLFGTMATAVPLVVSLGLSKVIMIKVWMFCALGRVFITTAGSVVLHLFGKRIDLDFYLWLTVFYAALIAWEVWAISRLLRNKVVIDNTAKASKKCFETTDSVSHEKISLSLQ